METIWFAVYPNCLLLILLERDEMVDHTTRYPSEPTRRKHQPYVRFVPRVSVSLIGRVGGGLVKDLEYPRQSPCPCLARI